MDATKTRLTRFAYGVEYIVYLPGRGLEARDALIESDIRCNRIDKDYVGIIHQFELVNALRHSPYKFFDTMVMRVPMDPDPKRFGECSEPWRSYTVLRALDECELEYVNKAVRTCPPMEDYVGQPDTEPKKTIKETIAAALDALSKKGFEPSEHGWYKVRMQV